MPWEYLKNRLLREAFMRRKEHQCVRSERLNEGPIDTTGERRTAAVVSTPQRKVTHETPDKCCHHSSAAYERIVLAKVEREYSKTPTSKRKWRNSVDLPQAGTSAPNKASPKRVTNYRLIGKTRKNGDAPRRVGILMKVPSRCHQETTSDPTHYPRVLACPCLKQKNVQALVQTSRFRRPHAA